MGAKFECPFCGHVRPSAGVADHLAQFDRFHHGKVCLACGQEVEHGILYEHVKPVCYDCAARLAAIDLTS